MSSARALIVVLAGSKIRNQIEIGAAYFMATACAMEAIRSTIAQAADKQGLDVSMLDREAHWPISVARSDGARLRRAVVSS